MHGEDTTCRASNSKCPQLVLIFNDGVHEHWRHKATLHHSVAGKYGEYSDFNYHKVKFSEDEVNPNNAYFALVVYGPEPGVDMTINSFDLFLPSQSSYPDPDALCDELVYNGDAEGNGFNPYPMVNSHWNERLTVVEEDGNKFWRNFARNNHRSGVRYKLDTNCLTRGVTYMMSAKVRYHYSDGFVGGSETYYWYIHYKRASDNSQRDHYIVRCAAQSVEDGWVTCSGEFMIDEDLSETTEAWLHMGLDNYRDGDKYNLDFDDISIRYSRGYVDELVVDSDDISCWGNGSDVHVTSASYYSWAQEKRNGFESQIGSVVDNGDGTANIQLNEAATLPIITEEENGDYAVEIALLSRNVKIEGEDDEDKKGGYFQVLHTPGIAQTIQGVEFFKMGRRSEVDRFVSDILCIYIYVYLYLYIYINSSFFCSDLLLFCLQALQLLYSGELEGTLISRNSFRQSNQRCISIEGTSNVTVSHNIGYRTSGHCIYIGYQSQYNSITNNLVSDTGYSPISWNERINGETDYEGAAFLNW